MTGARLRGRRVDGTSVAHAILTGVGIVLVATSSGYGLVRSDGQVGPGFLPLVVGLLLAGLAGVTLVQRLTRAGRSPVETGPADDGVDVAGRTPGQRHRQMWTVVGMVTLAIVLVPVLGFLVSFAALTFAVSALVERRAVAVAGVVTAVSVAAVYGLFVLFLEIPLPVGLLGIGG